MSPVSGFSEIEHTADKAVAIWADTLNGLYEEAARAMFSLMVDLGSITPTVRHSVTLPADDLETAMVDWLSELLFWRETRRELYSQFEVVVEAGRLRGEFAGQAGQPTESVVKAVTYHDLRVQQDAAGMWRATIVFDT
jgi:SHS2 domain-containing protein